MKFFIPGAESSEQADALFAQITGLPPVTRQLRSIRFEHGGRRFTAEVGKALIHPAEDLGIVLAIVETPTLIFVHTELRNATKGGPAFVSPGSVEESLYFDARP